MSNDIQQHLDSYAHCKTATLFGLDNVAFLLPGWIKVQKFTSAPSVIRVI